MSTDTPIIDWRFILINALVTAGVDEDKATLFVDDELMLPNTDSAVPS